MPWFVVYFFVTCTYNFYRTCMTTHTSWMQHFYFHYLLHSQKSTGKLRGRVPKSAVTSPYTGSNGTVSNFSAVRGCITLLYSPGRSIMLYGSSRGRGASQYFTVLNLPEVVVHINSVTIQSVVGGKPNCVGV